MTSLLACAADVSPAPEVVPAAVVPAASPIAAPPAWPSPAFVLRPPVAPPAPADPVRVVIDAGHGERGNLGNRSARCVREASFTLQVQEALLQRLEGRAGIQLAAGRPRGVLRDYADRIEAFDAWGGAVISVHSDARATAESRVNAQGCPENPGHQGFAVLWSDEGDEALVEKRRSLARAVAVRMIEAGFPPYDGGDYPGLYAPDAMVPGVFVDRHEARRRIRMLRRTHVPLVIVETHHALDPDEAARWTEPETFDAFAAAIHAAVLDWGG